MADFHQVLEEMLQQRLGFPGPAPRQPLANETVKQVGLRHLLGSREAWVTFLWGGLSPKAVKAALVNSEAGMELKSFGEAPGDSNDGTLSEAVGGGPLISSQDILNGHQINQISNELKSLWALTGHNLTY